MQIAVRSAPRLRTISLGRVVAGTGTVPLCGMGGLAPAQFTSTEPRFRHDF